MHQLAFHLIIQKKKKKKKHGIAVTEWPSQNKKNGISRPSKNAQKQMALQCWENLIFKKYIKNICTAVKLI